MSRSSRVPHVLRKSGIGAAAHVLLLDSSRLETSARNISHDARREILPGEYPALQPQSETRSVPQTSMVLSLTFGL